MKTLGLIALYCVFLFLIACGQSTEQKESTKKGGATSAVTDDLRSGPQAVTDLSEEEIAKMREAGTTCHTKYPVLFIHGIALRDKTLGIKYFGRVLEYINENCKVEVFEGGQDAFSISTVNAEQILKRVLEITDEKGFEKVNIIAHSKGGIDVRFMFFQAGNKLIDGRTLNDRIASFTTLSTPHRGSGLADYLLPKFGPKTQTVIAWFLDLFGLIVGDSSESSSKEAMNSLSSAKMNEWNDRFGDMEKGPKGVYCQSWASTIRGSIQDKILQTTFSMMKEIGMENNDGAVQEDSAKYVRFRGLIGKNLSGGISHFAMVDRARLVKEGDTPGWDAREFYANLLRELSGLGF